MTTGPIPSPESGERHDAVHQDALLTRIREGDAEALVVLMQTYAPMLVRFAASRVHDVDDAQDIVQDVFVMLWQRREMLNIRSSIKAYLLQATRYRVVSFMRSTRSRDRLHDKLDEGSGMAHGADQLDADELTRVMRAALDVLRPRTREIFLLSRQQGLSYAEIAETLGISLATVHNQMSLATQALAAAVSRWRDTGL